MYPTTQLMLDFATGLYKEHLEEASFLYEQRLTLFDDPEITWVDIGDFEDRFEPHIDGLVGGEELAIEVCKTQASEGDFGELHAAIRVFCRQNRKDLVLQILEELDPDDNECMKAVSDALKDEFPDNWLDDFLRMLSDGNQKVIPILANLFGHKRLKDWATILLEVMEKIPSNLLSPVIWALGRLGDQGARESLLKYLQYDDQFIRSAAALSLLRLGENKLLDQCLEHARFQNWPHIPLALGGNQATVNILLDLALTNEAESDCLTALGLLGDISAIPTLITYLDNLEVAESAALALHLITGAQLYEEFFVPDEIDEDELFEEELKKFKEGQVPTRPDGESFGNTITRLSQKREEWLKWWTENRSNFVPRIRYRNGRPYSPECLLENLESEHSHHKVRQLAYEELVIRYGIDFPFETDMSVIQQKQSIAQYAEWIKINGSRFHEGQWYFAGQKQASQ